MTGQKKMGEILWVFFPSLVPAPGTEVTIAKKMSTTQKERNPPLWQTET